MIYSLIKKIPVIRVFVIVTNTYVLDGNINGIIFFAGWRNYFKKFWFRLGMPLMFSLGTRFLVAGDLQNKIEHINTIALSILPNLVGFGIGAYAFIFSLSREYFSRLKETTGVPSGFALVNVSFAFPLIVIIGWIVIFFMIDLFRFYHYWLSMTGFLVCIIMLIDIVGAVFFMAMHNEKIKKA